MTRTRAGFVLIATGALVLAGVVAFLLWPRSPADAEVIRGGSASYAVELRVDPMRTGPTTTVARLSRHDGAPVAVNEVSISSAMADMGHAMPALVADRRGERFEAHGELFLMAGVWEISVRIDTKADSETVTVTVLVQR